MEERLNLDESMDNRLLKIIGVEFTILTPRGNIQELGMWVPNGNGIVIPRERSANNWNGFYRPLITFHSTIGDYQIGRMDNQCPW